jgi:hypothetical protein
MDIESFGNGNSLVLLIVAETIACMKQVEVVQELKISSFEFDADRVLHTNEVKCVKCFSLSLRDGWNVWRPGYVAESSKSTSDELNDDAFIRGYEEDRSLCVFRASTKTMIR